MIVSVSGAKTNLSRLLDMVYHGESVVITKNNQPVADLVAHKPAKNKKILKTEIGIVSKKYEIDLQCMAIVL